MDKVLPRDFERPDYPINVKFSERKKEEGAQGMWCVRENEIELIIVNNGELSISCGEKVYKIGAGKGFVINARAPHRITSSAKEDTAFYSVVFDPSFATGDDTSSAIYREYVIPVLDSEKLNCLMLDEDNLIDEAVLDKINDIIAANTIKKWGYEVITKSYICTLWSYLLEYLSGKETYFNGRNVPSQDELRIRSAVQFIEESYQDPISLVEIADHIHISRNECCRCFKRVTMLSPVEYLNRYRIYRAAKTIYKDPLSVDGFSDLAFSTGFNNASYFNKMFRRYLECTPSEFTGMLKNEPEKAKKLFDNLQDSVTGFI